MSFSHLLALVFCFSSLQVLAEVSPYSRFKLYQDRFKYIQSLHPLEHDFAIQADVLVSKELIELIHKYEKIKKETNNDKVAEVLRIEQFMRDIDKLEQFAQVDGKVQVPFWSFHLFDTIFRPSIRYSTDLATLLTIRTIPLAGLNVNLVDLFPELPNDIKAKLSNFTIPQSVTPGADLADVLIAQNIVPADYANSLRGKYFVPDIRLPNINLYLKSDIKLGANLEFERYFFFKANIFIYNLHRRDDQVTINENVLRRNTTLIRFNGDNSQNALMTDLSFKYEIDRYAISAAIEEIKIHRSSDNIETHGDLIYQYPPLYTFKTSADYYLFGFLFRPNLGFYVRNGYTIKDGLFAGLENQWSFARDRFKLGGNLHFDREYISYNLLAKFWLISIQYNILAPYQKTNQEGLQTTFIHGLSIRFNL